MDKNSDEIDFSKLEKELNAAIEADSKYSRENAAKFRAVEQRVGSYEEFRDIVLASNLKPLERKDILGETQRHQPLNSICNAKQTNLGTQQRNPSQVSNNQVEENMPSQPKSADEFVKSWKKLLSVESSKYVYITKIKTAVLEKLLVSEQIGNMLGEILVVLEKFFVSIDIDKMIDILKSLKMSKRFSLWLQFLTKTEKQSMVKLFEKLEETADDEQRTIVIELKNEFLRLHC